MNLSASKLNVLDLKYRRVVYSDFGNRMHETKQKQRPIAMELNFIKDLVKLYSSGI